MLILFGGLLVIPFVLNLLASRDDYRRYVDALFISGMLAAIWAFTNSMRAILDFPTSMQFHPLVDLIALSVIVAAYMTQRQRWKLALARLFLAQLCAHAAFWWTWYQSPVGSSGRVYVLSLNVLWMAQLVCVGWPGGRHLVVRALSHLRHTRNFPYAARR